MKEGFKVFGSLVSIFIGVFILDYEFYSTAIWIAFIYALLFVLVYVLNRKYSALNDKFSIKFDSVLPFISNGKHSALNDKFSIKLDSVLAFIFSLLIFCLFINKTDYLQETGVVLDKSILGYIVERSDIKNEILIFSLGFIIIAVIFYNLVFSNVIKILNVIRDYVKVNK